MRGTTTLGVAGSSSAPRFKSGRPGPGGPVTGQAPAKRTEAIAMNASDVAVAELAIAPGDLAGDGAPSAVLREGR